MSERNYTYSNTGLFPVRLINCRRGGATSEVSKKNLNKGYKTLGVSQATQRKIITACRVLSYSAEKRKVKNTKGNYIEHLTLFITLTLPAPQQHEDKEITKVCLGSFFDKLRKLGLFSNYVWRAEKQKNGNIHYHIITDSYAHFSLIKRAWLVAVEKLGYLSAYRSKFANMSLSQYAQLDFNRGKKHYEIANAYANGTRTKWGSPPCIDVASVGNIGGTARYISKYVSKSDSNDKNIVTGRVWGCSQSVSSAVEIFKRDVEFNTFWFNVAQQIFKVKEYSTDFFTIAKFSFTRLKAWYRDAYDYILSRLREVFQPCSYYENYRCLFAENP